jgi:hypothetical protein
MYCVWHAGSSWGRPKTGLFNVTLGSSKVVLDSITSVTVPKAEEREAIKRFGLGKAVKVERRGEVNFVVQWIRNRSLIRYIVNWGKLSSIFPVHLTTACKTPGTLLGTDGPWAGDYRSTGTRSCWQMWRHPLNVNANRFTEVLFQRLEHKIHFLTWIP